MQSSPTDAWEAKVHQAHSDILHQPHQTPPVAMLLRSHLAVLIKSVLDLKTCSEWSKAVLEHRSEWINHFDGALYTLGRSWYTDLEQDREALYFANARRSDALVEKCAPSLQSYLITLLGQLLGDSKIKQRTGWCGPGIHAIPPSGCVAENGGEAHFDTEGIEKDLEKRPPCLTVVLMLQPPEYSGGGLRVWDLLWDAVKSHGVSLEELEKEKVPFDDAIYETGDLLVLDAYRLHQILPFSGSKIRISATAHAVWDQAEQHWLVWF